MIQTGPVKEALKSEHLEELLDICFDQPQNLYSYSTLEGEKKLIQSALIKEVKLTKEYPNSLIIDYTTREPIAYLSDYENLVVDQDGVLFPLSPFFTPKVLPEVYLGIKIEPFKYGKLCDEKLELALKILNLFEQYHIKGLTIKKIDISKLRVESLGQQEIVITLIEELGKKNYLRFLRLTHDHYPEELEHFFSLKQMSLPQDFTIDLRLLPNAYLNYLDMDK